MAINFPNAPSSGQVYEYGDYTYTFDGVKWTSILRYGLAAAKVSSETPPPNPEAGLMWYVPSTGESYLYYVDEDGGQWIQENPSIGAVAHNLLEGVNPADGSAHNANDIRNITTSYTSISELKSDASLVVGVVCITKGFYNAGDGGGATYIVSSLDSPDGHTSHLTDGGLQVDLIGNVIDCRQCGVGFGEVNSQDGWDAIASKYNSGHTIIISGISNVDNVQWINPTNLLIEGSGVIRKKDSATNANYSLGASFAFINSKNVKINGNNLLTFDGNKTNQTNSGMNFGIVFALSSGDFRSVTGGDTTKSMTSEVSGCIFRDHGTITPLSADNFGDGILAVGCDGIDVHHNVFIDNERWGAVFSDVFNAKFRNNWCYNLNVQQYGLGFFDLENEGTDPVNGSYSRGVQIHGNIGVGNCRIAVGSYVLPDNPSSLLHYLKDVDIYENQLRLSDNVRSLTGIELRGEEFITAVSGMQHENITFRNNTVRSLTGNHLAGIRIGVYGVPSVGSTFTNIKVIGNTITNCLEYILIDATLQVGGYILQQIQVTGNDLYWDIPTEGKVINGLTMSAPTLYRCKVSNNTVRSVNNSGVFLRDNHFIFQENSSQVQVFDNTFEQSDGAYINADVTTIQLRGNEGTGAESADLQLYINGFTTVEIDRGNQWNTRFVNIPAQNLANGATFLSDTQDMNTKLYGSAYSLNAMPEYNTNGMTYIPYMNFPTRSWWLRIVNNTGGTQAIGGTVGVSFTM